MSMRRRAIQEVLKESVEGFMSTRNKTNLGSQDAAVPEATRRFRQATRNIVLGLREGQDVEALTERLHRSASTEEVGPPPKWWSPKTDIAASGALLRSSWLNLFIVCCPLGIMSKLLGWGATPTFLLNLAGLIPLALILGEVTEDLALRLGDVIGGLLNATFGNVVELILSIAALSKGLFEVVAMSLLGSVLSNLLLVLGGCFLAGGIKYKQQHFNEIATRASASLLFVSAIGIIIPTAAEHMQISQHMNGGTDSGGLPHDKIVLISRLTAIALLLTYIAYLTFQLKTHGDLFDAQQEEGEGEEGAQPMLTLTASLFWLLGITVVVATCSEFLTGAIEEVSEDWKISQGFLGLIVLPIAGNACEHITAVIVAMRNKMDLAMGVAVGSSIQIALFAIPFVTLTGWVIGQPFSLSFSPFATLILFVSVLHADFVIFGGSSHWLLGLQLIVTYFLIAVAFAVS